MHIDNPKDEPSFIEGRESFEADQEITDNPYPETSIDFELWRNGWLAASFELLERQRQGKN